MARRESAASQVQLRSGKSYLCSAGASTPAVWRGHLQMNLGAPTALLAPLTVCQKTPPRRAPQEHLPSGALTIWSSFLLEHFPSEHFPSGAPLTRAPKNTSTQPWPSDSHPRTATPQPPTSSAQQVPWVTWPQYIPFLRIPPSETLPFKSPVRFALCLRQRLTMRSPHCARAATLSPLSLQPRCLPLPYCLRRRCSLDLPCLGTVRGA